MQSREVYKKSRSLWISSMKMVATKGAVYNASGEISSRVFSSDGEGETALYVLNGVKGVLSPASDTVSGTSSK
jgi:hypothetical protein